MHTALRALPLALGAMFAVSTIRAQPAELPPIFAPRIVTPPPAATPRSVPVSGISDRLRALITERVLVEVKAFESPVATAAGAESTTFTVEAPLMMQRFLVRSVVPRREEIEPPDIPTWQFGPADRIDRRVKGYSATLLRLSENLFLNLNVLNGAGQGIDHGREFTRVELEFSLKPALTSVLPLAAKRPTQRKGP